MNKRPREEDGLASRKIAKHDVGQLPDEMLCTAFGYLALYELLVVARVCKRWMNVSRDPALWKRAVLLREKVGVLRVPQDPYYDPAWSWWARIHRLPSSLDGDFRWIREGGNEPILRAVARDRFSARSLRKEKIIYDLQFSWPDAGGNWKPKGVAGAVVMKTRPAPRGWSDAYYFAEEGVDFFFAKNCLRARHLTFSADDPPVNKTKHTSSDCLWRPLRVEKATDPLDVVYDESGPGLAIRIVDPSSK